MGLQLPEGMMQALAQAGGGMGGGMGMGGQGGPPLPAALAGGDSAYDSQEDPLRVLQDCINGLPKVIAALPDPQDTQDAIQALHILSKIQKRLSGNKGGASGPAQG